MSRRGTVLTALLLGTLAACSSTTSERPNFVLVVVDTLRADRLGCYGNERGLTPFLDSVAERSFVFRRAYAQSSWTNPSVASLFTSRFPSQHGVTEKPRTAPAPSLDELTLAEVLHESGYATAAFIANGGLRGSPAASRGGSGSGFGQGFEIYRLLSGHWKAEGKKHLWRHARAEEVDREAVGWLRRRPSTDHRPLFLYLHYMEPHVPYEPSDDALALVGRDRAAVASLNRRRWVWLSERKRLSPADLRLVEDVYDAEVASLDAALGDLFRELAELGVLDRAIVVLTSDHGEEFFEHGALGHGASLYDTLIRVPLIVRTPEQSARVDVDELVSQIDVGPTLLDWIGAPASGPFMGVSFRPRMRLRSSLWRRLAASFWKESGPEPPALSELIRPEDWRYGTTHETAVILGTRKLISGYDGKREYYDLSADPGERQEGRVPERERVALQEALFAFRRAGGGTTTATSDALDEAHLDEAEKERLRALGY